MAHTEVYWTEQLLVKVQDCIHVYVELYFPGTLSGVFMEQFSCVKKCVPVYSIFNHCQHPLGAPLPENEL